MGEEKKGGDVIKKEGRIGTLLLNYLALYAGK